MGWRASPAQSGRTQRRLERSGRLASDAGSWVELCMVAPRQGTAFYTVSSLLDTAASLELYLALLNTCTSANAHVHMHMSCRFDDMMLACDMLACDGSRHMHMHICMCMSTCHMSERRVHWLCSPPTAGAVQRRSAPGCALCWIARCARCPAYMHTQCACACTCKGACTKCMCFVLSSQTGGPFSWPTQNRVSHSTTTTSQI